MQVVYNRRKLILHLRCLERRKIQQENIIFLSSLTLHPVPGLVCIPNLHQIQPDCLGQLLACLELRSDLSGTPTDQKKPEKQISVLESGVKKKQCFKNRIGDSTGKVNNSRFRGRTMGTGWFDPIFKTLKKKTGFLNL